MVYAPGTLETDQKKQNMALQQQASAITTNTTDIATNTANIATNTANITALMPGYLFGLTLSTAGSSATFSVASGVASDSAGTSLMQLSSSISKTTSAWAVGSGNGGLDTGSIANNTWYHVYLIKRTDTGVVDVLISTSASSPTMPTSYTLKRRIGAMRTNGSAQWTLFSQLGDEFLWDVPVNDVLTNNNSTASGTLRTLSVPTGLKVFAIITAAFQGANNPDEARYYVSAPDVTDAAGAANNLNAGAFVSGASFTFQAFSAMVRTRTNTSAQIRTRGLTNDASTYIWINTFGWIDRRGQDS